MPKRKGEFPEVEDLAKRIKLLEGKICCHESDSESENSENWAVEYLDSEKEASEDDEVIIKDESIKVEQEDTFQLPDEVRKLLGELKDDDKKVGPNIIPEMAQKVQKVLKEGLEKEERIKILANNPPPGNCTNIEEQTLNPEIAAVLSSKQISGDKKAATRQEKIGVALAAVLKFTNNLIKIGDKENISPLIKAISVLADIQFYDSKMRRSVILPVLDKKLIHFLDESSVDGSLFGRDFGTKIRQFKAVGRSGINIRAKNFQTKNRYLHNTKDQNRRGEWKPTRLQQPSGACTLIQPARIEQLRNNKNKIKNRPRLQNASKPQRRTQTQTMRK